MNNVARVTLAACTLLVPAVGIGYGLHSWFRAGERGQSAISNDELAEGSNGPKSPALRSATEARKAHPSRVQPVPVIPLKLPTQASSSRFAITPERALKHEVVRAELDRLAGEAASSDMGLNDNDSAKVREVFRRYHAAHLRRMERGPVPLLPGEELPYDAFEREMKSALGNERYRAFMDLKTMEHARIVQARRALRQSARLDAAVP